MSCTSAGVAAAAAARKARELDLQAVVLQFAKGAGKPVDAGVATLKYGGVRVRFHIM